MNLPIKQHRRTLAVLILVLLSGAVLRLLLLGHKCFGADEGVIWWMALGQIQHDAPPIYIYAFGWAIHLFGWCEFAGRMPPAIFGMLSIVVIYAFGITVFDRKFALYSAFLAAISAYLIPISQEMRIYSLLGLEILLALWFFLQILKERKASAVWWLALLIVGVIGQYTHCFFIFVLGYFGVVLFIRTGWKGWRVWTRYLLVLIAVILVGAPELSKTFSVASTRQHLYATDFFHFEMNVFRVLRTYFGFLYGDYLTNLPGSLIPYLKAHPLRLLVSVAMMGSWIIIAVGGLRISAKIVRGHDFQSLAIRTLIGMLLAFTVLFFIVDVSTGAHLIFIYVPFLFIVTIYWARGKGIFKKVLFALFLILTAVSLFTHYGLPYAAYERADWRAASTLFERELNSADALLLFRSRNAYYTLKFYHPELNAVTYYTPRHDPALLNDRALAAWWRNTNPVEKVNSLLERYSRVWVVEADLHLNEDAAFGIFPYRLWDFGEDLRVYLIKREDIRAAEI